MSDKPTHASRIRIPSVVLLLFVLLLPFLVFAKDDYYRHTYFDNSLTQDFYFYSDASAVAPSVLLQKNGRLPVETKIFFTPPNALRLEWQSREDGGWEAEIGEMLKKLDAVSAK